MPTEKYAILQRARSGNTEVWDGSRTNKYYIYKSNKIRCCRSDTIIANVRDEGDYKLVKMLGEASFEPFTLEFQRETYEWVENPSTSGRIIANLEKKQWHWRLDGELEILEDGRPISDRIIATAIVLLESLSGGDKRWLERAAKRPLPPRPSSGDSSGHSTAPSSPTMITITHTSNSPEPDTPIELFSQEQLRRQLDRLKQDLRESNQGCYHVEIFVNNDGYKTVRLNYIGMTQTELSILESRGAALHKSFENISMGKDYPGSTLIKFDPEAIPGYAGLVPGTVSVVGYGAKYLNQQYVRNSIVDPVPTTSSNAFPRVLVKKIIERIEDLQDLGPSVIGSTEEECCNKLQEIIGSESIGETSVRAQIAKLCEILNRDSFIDLSKYSNICANFKSPRLRYKFAYQMLLGYELLIRLRIKSSTTSYSLQINQKISANLLISEQWMENVRLTNVFRSGVHDQQLRGMIQFAYSLKWPYLDETRHFMRNSINNRNALESITNTDILGWIYGLTLPGKEFRLRIMSCLAYTVEPVRRFGVVPSYKFGLVLFNASYWPSGTVLDRVLGGMRNVRTICGWTGPCPTVDNQNITGWIRVRARKLPLSYPDEPRVFDLNQDEEISEILKSLHDSHSLQVEDLCRRYEQLQNNEIIQDISDFDNWIEPLLNINPEQGTLVVLERIRLETRDPDERREYKAILHFNINGSVIQYTLSAAPCFITAPPCYGRHLMFRDLAIWYAKNVVSAVYLKDYVWDGHQFLIINALGEGQEVLARAWCAENGRHAVIRRGSDCCFTCAVTLSGIAGLRLNLLIWA